MEQKLKKWFSRCYSATPLASSLPYTEATIELTGIVLEWKIIYFDVYFFLQKIVPSFFRNKEFILNEMTIDQWNSAKYVSFLFCANTID